MTTLEEVKQLAQLAAQIGVPTVVAFYLLTVFRKTLQELRDAVRDLTAHLKKSDTKSYGESR